MDNYHHLNIIEFIQDLEERGERLELVDGRLHYSACQGSPREEDIQLIRTHRDKLMDWLQEKASRPNEYPLSVGQQGLWMAWRLAPESPIYNLFFVARLQKDIDLAILKQALQLLVEKHPILRTCYPQQEGREESHPLQRIDENFVVDLPIHDGENWTDAMIEAWMEQETERAFDLTQGPVMRTSVLQTSFPASVGEIQRLFHWTIHHIASDFLTQEVLIEDFEGFYRAMQTQSIPQVPQTELDYRAFVRWEQDVIRQQGESLRTYWQNQIERCPANTNLPIDLIALNVDDSIDSNANNNYRGATLDFTLDATLTDALRSFSQNHHISLFTFLLTAYQIVLARYSGRNHFLVTTPTSVRHLAGWQRTAGYLINPLCLEADLSGSPSISTLLKRTQSHLSTAFEHQMLPFLEVLRMLQATHSSKPTFGFILDAARRPARAPSLFAETLAIGQCGTPEEISMSMFDMGGELSGQVTYNANRFLPHSIQRLINYLKVAIRSILDNQEQSVSDLPLLTFTEQQQILTDWTATTVQAETGDSDAGNLPLPVQFIQQVERTPDAIALIEASKGKNNASISYRELNHWADHVARQLRIQGAGRETLVGVFVDRSIAMVAGLLGIFKAGAAYLPLDPNYPRTRLEYVLSDSGASLLITQTHLLEQLPKTSAKIITIEKETVPSSSLADLHGEATVTVDPEDLAYVTYTSGSTGKPKGVQALHRATNNRLSWMWRTMPFTSGEICCQKTTLSFVDSVWEIFGPLLQGIASVIIPTSVVKDVPKLIETLANNKVTRIVLVPSLLRAILDAEAHLQQRLPRLKHWICSGETLPIDLVRRFYVQFPEARLINLYGSSEVAADVTWYDTARLKNPERSLQSLPRVPIGQPIDNVQCYILNDQGKLVPPGMEGELYIGGDCLARGYHQRPEMTRERFIDNPFGSGQLFRTGDRARWLPMEHLEHANASQRPDIEFLGRNDSQVKIRGFRVELSEIETRLRLHPAVSDAVVQLQQHASGARLIAYVEAVSEHPTTEELYWYLQQDLPDYMLPGAFVIMDSLPLTPNDKVDRQALSQLDISEQVNERAVVPPATELEQAVANIWAKRLGVAQVGRHDNFFVLGGHSLLATQVVLQIQTEFQVVLPLQIVFDHPTIAELASQIEARQMASRLSTPSSNNSSDQLDILL